VENIWTYEQISKLHSRELRHFIFCVKFLNWYSGGVESTWVHSALRSAQGDYDDEEIGGMIGRGNRSTQR
jgi:hypothetical protein